MSSSSESNYKFNYKFNFINRLKEMEEIPFCEEWNNGTGYLDGAVHADLGLKPGDARRFITSNARKGFIVNTRLGNVVVFERYCLGESHVLVCNAPPRIKQMFDLSSQLDESKLQRIITSTSNIGLDMEELYTDMERRNKRAA